MSLSTALISVDLVVFQLSDNGRLQVLGHGAPESSKPTLPAGRIDADQDQCLEDTAKRQLDRFISTPASYFEQVVTIGDNQRDSRGWSMTVVYYALVRPCLDNIIESSARWIDVCDGLPVTSLAYDHDQLVTGALDRLKNKIQYSVLPLYLLPDEFILSDIQKVFSVVLGKAPPMRSIRNRFLSCDILQETGEKRYGSNRPAVLYRTNSDSKHWLFDRLYQTVKV
ncbi:NUDIX hydrolase [Endozoicomonas ascidiicola]|uniref:NUDIX hydrolase n=1 Tax=Endozoicomonas ascidiicola TaxID=1698521 RepID=UPI0008359C6E|nr:NUDIX hydrolase [Endozoicomonas ascidiicola]